MIELKTQIDTWLHEVFNPAQREYVALKPEEQAKVLDVNRLIKRGEWVKMEPPKPLARTSQWFEAIDNGQTVEVARNTCVGPDGPYQVFSLVVREANREFVLSDSHIAKDMYRELLHK